jgi:tetratricopeptide (TPR) repeat protein
MRFPIACLIALATACFPTNSHAAQECGSTPYECAAFHASRGQFGEAIRLVEEVLAKAPTDLKALNLAGIALTGIGKIDEANARFREAVRLDRRFYPALKNLAINEFTAGRFQDAQRHLVEVLELAPDDEVAHLHLGEIDFDRKNVAGALAHYEKAGVRVAQNPTWTLHYASCLLDQHQKDKAVAVLDALPPADADSRFEAGMILGRSGAHAEAARFFGTARERYKDPGAAGYNQTLMLVEAGDYDAAVGVAQEMFDRGRQSSELYNLVARAHEKAGRVKEAYDALRAATTIAPSAEENYVDLASICLEHQNFDLGLEIIDIGLQHRPDSSLLHLQRGVLMAMRAELGPAEAEFETARRLAPGAPAPYAGLAMIWMQTGQTDKAVDVLRKEARARRDHVVPYIFAVALMRSGLDPAGPGAAEAVTALQSSIGANPRFAPSHSELGRLLLKRDDLDGAIRELETAIALDAENTAAIYNLAQAYRKKGDRARAADLLARVTKLNAQERGDDPAADLKRTVLRIVRDGPAPKP